MADQLYGLTGAEVQRLKRLLDAFENGQLNQRPRYRRKPLHWISGASRKVVQFHGGYIIRANDGSPNSLASNEIRAATNGGMFFEEITGDLEAIGIEYLYDGSTVDGSTYNSALLSFSEAGAYLFSWGFFVKRNDINSTDYDQPAPNKTATTSTDNGHNHTVTHRAFNTENWYARGEVNFKQSGGSWRTRSQLSIAKIVSTRIDDQLQTGARTALINVPAECELQIQCLITHSSGNVQGAVITDGFLFIERIGDLLPSSETGSDALGVDATLDKYDIPSPTYP